MRTTIKIVAGLGLAALLLAMIFSGDRARPPGDAPTTSPAEPDRSASSRGGARDRTRPARGASSAERPALPPSSAGANANEAAPADERTAPPLTPHQLYASRASRRMTLLAILARRHGEVALADATEALGDELWASAEPTREARDVVALLDRQAELIARFKGLATHHPDEPLLASVIKELDGDLAATRRGQPRGSERKLETEADELPRNNEAEDEPEGRAGPSAG